MVYRIASGLLALTLTACGARPVTVAVIPSPTPAGSAPTRSPEPSPHLNQRVLDIKIHYQEHNLSCEAAALKMALSYEGIAVDEMTLVGYMTNDRRPAQFDSKGRLVAWGDPAQSFVGDPDGHIERLT